MTQRQPDHADALDDTNLSPKIEAARVVLAVEPESWPQVELKHEPHCSLVVTRFAHLAPGLLARVRPCAVLAPLIGPEFDALDVLHTLERAAFAGNICVICPATVELAPIQAELLAAAPPDARVMLFAPGARIMPCAPLRHPR